MHVFDLAIGTAGGAAADGPGAQSYYDLGRKDCAGTAADTASKVWYTVADGMLSDVYFPTIDNTNVKDLEYIVTDGSAYTDVQPRDMTYTVRALGAAGLAAR
jgi:glucoamylase